MVIKPLTRPIFSCNGLTIGARQLVVQLAFEITVSDDFNTPSFTPYTIVASTSAPPGAEIITFFAPPLMCALALSFDAKKPVHSSTTSTPRSPQGSLDGSRSARTLIRSPLTIMSSPSTLTSPGKRPCAVSYLVRCALVSVLPRSLIATTSNSLLRPASNRARKMLRPMRP